MSPSSSLLPAFRFSLLSWIGLMIGPKTMLPDTDQAEESRARRDFVLDMMDRHPAAFASEYDVQEMLRLFPRRF